MIKTKIIVEIKTDKGLFKNENDLKLVNEGLTKATKNFVDNLNCFILTDLKTTIKTKIVEKKWQKNKTHK